MTRVTLSASTTREAAVLISAFVVDGIAYCFLIDHRPITALLRRLHADDGPLVSC